MTTNASSVDDRVDLSLGFGHLTLDSDAQSTTGANTPITPLTSTSAERPGELPEDATSVQGPKLSSRVNFPNHVVALRSTH